MLFLAKQFLRFRLCASPLSLFMLNAEIERFQLLTLRTGRKRINKEKAAGYEQIKIIEKKNLEK